MKLKILILTLILLVITAWGVFSGQDQASEVDRLDTSGFETPRRPGAVFAHDDHNEAAGLEDCALCHHVWDGKKLVADESSEDSLCSECHGLSQGVDNGVSLSNAFHKRCKDCHFESGKGPVLCGQCHINK